MPIVKVSLQDRTYDITIEKGSLLRTDFSSFKAEKYAILTDSNVSRLHGKNLQASLRNKGLDAELLEFPAGEESKTPETAIFLGRKLAERGFGRKSLVIALGGGVVGDLAGYIASFYKRGIDYVQVPTTLVAQVDSSIGGKTGVDIPEGKNMFGSFYQPKAVLADIETLKTLPEREIRNGLAEIIKYGVTQDKELFEEVEENFSFRNLEFYFSIVEKSCRIKAKIVEKDERESELRKILNYGHTIGHAIEACEGYKISHGEAVGLGMVYEGKISSRVGLLDKYSLDRQNQAIEKVGLPVSYKGNPDILIEFMKRDKKNDAGKIYFILPTALGAVKSEDEKIAFPVDEALIRECLGD